ncbi:MAG: DUF1653 domain-containing protein [Suilimivivens sp.]
MANIPMPQQIYRHFKGNLYQIISLAEHTETGEQLVIYQAMYGDFKIYARPLSMFLEKVDHVKYPEAVQEYRFELMEREVNLQPRDFAQNKEREQVKQHSPQWVEDLADTAEVTREESEEVLDIDPLVLQFLDAGSYEERLDILASLHHRITDDMINTMAMAVDIEVKEGDTEERYAELRKCLLLYDKFECTRLR